MVPQRKMVGCKLATPWWGWMVCQLLQWVIRMSSACSKPCRWEILSSWKLCEDILCPLTLMILVWRQLVHTLWYSADHLLGQSLQYHVPLKITVQLILHFPLLLLPWLKDREQWTSGLQEQVFFQFLCYTLQPLLYRIQNDNKFQIHFSCKMITNSLCKWKTTLYFALSWLRKAKTHYHPIGQIFYWNFLPGLYFRINGFLIRSSLLSYLIFSTFINIEHALPFVTRGPYHSSRQRSHGVWIHNCWQRLRSEG